MVGGGRGEWGNVCCYCKPAEVSAADHGSSRQNFTKFDKILSAFLCFLVLHFNSDVHTNKMAWSGLEMCDIHQHAVFLLKKTHFCQRIRYLLPGVGNTGNVAQIHHQGPCNQRQ